ncbi:MAG: hypothetical protein Q7V63_07035 [Gammaproteobacteria bacterium]|nr:hypothetical protein [Gammaproteobacteria bacterium]
MQAAIGVAVKSAGATIGNLLVSAVLSRLDIPSASPSDPVIVLDKTINEVFALYLAAFKEADISNQNNPVVILPDEAGNPSTVLSNLVAAKYLKVSNLRRRFIIDAEFRPIIDSIIGKIRIFNAERNPGWFPGSISWDTTGTISNYPLIIFLLIAISVNAVGDAARELDPDTGIKVVEAIKSFCLKINGSHMLKPVTPTSKDEIRLVELLSEDPAIGIIADLDVLMNIFASKKSRDLFQIAAKHGNTCLSQAIDKVDKYFLSWLYGNQDPSKLPSLQEILMASSIITKYPDYRFLRTVLLREEVNYIATIKKVCAASKPELSPNIYWLMQLLFLPISIESVVATEGSFEERLVVEIAKNMSILPNKGELTNACLKRTFLEKMQSLLAEMKYIYYSASGVISKKERAFSDDESAVIANRLWDVFILRHHLKQILEIGKELHYVSVILGAFVGGYIPEISTFFIDLLKTARVRLVELDAIIKDNSLTSRHNSLEYLPKIKNSLLEEFKSLDRDFTKVISDMSEAKSGDYLASMDIELRKHLSAVVRKLSIVFPDKKTDFEREFHNVMSRVGSIGTRASTPIETARPTPPATTALSPIAITATTPLSTEVASISAIGLSRQRCIDALSKKEHLDTINEAHAPTSSGAWKSTGAIEAKHKLGVFIHSKGHNPEQKLAIDSFISYSLEDLHELIRLLLKVYSVSKKTKKHGLMGSLVDDILISPLISPVSAFSGSDASPAAHGAGITPTPGDRITSTSSPLRTELSSSPVHTSPPPSQTTELPSERSGPFTAYASEETMPKGPEMTSSTAPIPYTRATTILDSLSPEAKKELKDLEDDMMAYQ